MKDIKLNKNKLLLNVKNKKLYAILCIKNKSIKFCTESLIFNLKSNAEICPNINFHIIITDFRIVRLKNTNLLV